MPDAVSHSAKFKKIDIVVCRALGYTLYSMKSARLAPCALRSSSVLFLVVLAVAQTQPPDIGDSTRLLPGLVVEDAAASHEGQRAGLLKGDILLA